MDKHGFVYLIDQMPHENGDAAIVQAARVSYKNSGSKTISEDRGLIRYLMRHRHTTPFEMCEYKFHCKMPIFVARQWIRHRTASVNEISGRYSEMKDEFWFPEKVRLQSKTNKQGAGDEEYLGLLDTDIFLRDIDDICDRSYEVYKEQLNKGVSKELARVVLPLNLYTEWYWKIDLKNLLGFLELRCDKHAQAEFREYADIMLELIKPHVPLTIEAWEDYSEFRQAIKFTRLELECLKALINGQTDAHETLIENKREQAEWLEKRKRVAGI